MRGERWTEKNGLADSNCNKYWRGYGEKETLINHWWECRLVQPPLNFMNTCLVSQDHNWRQIFPHKGLNLEPQPHMWFGKYISIDETLNLDFRVDAGMSSDFGVVGLEWVHSVCEKDANLGGRGIDCYAQDCVPQILYIDDLTLNVTVFGDRTY